jgi:putative membrane protein
MTTQHMIRLMSCAGMLALGAGCSKGQDAEEVTPPEPEVTQGGETQKETQQAITALETHRMNKSSRELSAENSKDLQQLQEGQYEEQQPVYVQQPVAQVSAPADQQLSDSEIVHVADVVNNGEVEQAQIAKTKAKNPKVKQFAARMLTDHRKAEQTDAKVVEREGIIPEESATATEIAGQSTAALEALRTAEPGPNFDRLYIERQVAQHEKVLDLLDKQLIPSAANGKVESELEKTRGMATRHLTQALEIEHSLRATE